jgi:hypothetical protein
MSSDDPRETALNLSFYQLDSSQFSLQPSRDQQLIKFDIF